MKQNTSMTKTQRWLFIGTVFVLGMALVLFMDHRSDASVAQVNTKAPSPARVSDASARVMMQDIFHKPRATRKRAVRRVSKMPVKRRIDLCYNFHVGWSNIHAPLYWVQPNMVRRTCRKRHTAVARNLVQCGGLGAVTAAAGWYSGAGAGLLFVSAFGICQMTKSIDFWARTIR